MNLGLGVAITSVRPITTGALPPKILVIEGDSITSLAPLVETPGTYSWMYKAARPSITSYVTAQGSRALDTNAPNSLLAHRDEDLAYNAGALTFMIGANDLIFASSVANYYGRLISYAAPFRAAGTKVFIATTLPFGTNHPSYAEHNARIDQLIPMIRAGIGTDFDGLIPFDAHPVLGDRALWLSNVLASDGVHANGSDNATPGKEAHDHMFDVYAAVMDSFFAGRPVNAPPTNLSFGADVPSAPLSTLIERDYIVRGLRYGETKQFSVAGTGAQIKKGVGAYGSTVNACNGEVIRLGVTSADAPLTERVIEVAGGGVATTFKVKTGTGAVHGETFADIFKVTPGSATVDQELTFAEDGFAIVLLNALGNSGTETLTSAGIVGGASANPLGSSPIGGTKLDALIMPVVAGTRTLRLTHSGQMSRLIFSVSFLKNINPVPVDFVTRGTDQGADPQTFEAMDCPAGGLIYGGLIIYTGGSWTPAPSPAGGGNTLLDVDTVLFNGENRGLAVAKRVTSGELAINTRGFSGSPGIAFAFEPA
jgi:hypothetical protein